MNKSDLISSMASKMTALSEKDVELSIKSIIEQMARSLSQGKRIEVRGFGSFSLHYRKPRVGRNPKTGEPVSLSGRHNVHFKPGKELAEIVNHAKQNGVTISQYKSEHE